MTQIANSSAMSQPPSDVAVSEPEGEKDAMLAQKWRRVAERLRAELGEDVFVSWFARLELKSAESGVASMSASTRFLKSWIEAHYGERLLAQLKREFPKLLSVRIDVRSSARVQPAAEEGRKTFAPRVDEGRVRHDARPSADGAGKIPAAANEAAAGAPLDRRLTFDTFMLGRANQMAFDAARRVGERAGVHTPEFNPLYVHSAVGLGKTHLLQAIAHRATALGRNVVYLTANHFMHGFVAALQSQSAVAFKERLRSIDLLIFDDAQFLKGKAIPEEFGHLLNEMIDSGRQVVVAADRPPGELGQLDQRMRSRLAGGLCAEILDLDEALRVKILESRIAAAKTRAPSFTVSSAVVHFVARSIVSNGRDLEGAVNRLVAHSSFQGALTVEVAEAAIRDLIGVRNDRRVRIEDIQKLVATHYQVTRADLLSSRRNANVVKPRQVAMFLAKSLTLRSYPEIGRRFGGRDHTTVLHAVRKIEGLCKSDTGLKEDVDLLTRMLLD